MDLPPSHIFSIHQPHAARTGRRAGEAGAGANGRAPTGTRGAAAGCRPPLLDRECCAMPPVQSSWCRASPRHPTLPVGSAGGAPSALRSGLPGAVPAARRALGGGAGGAGAGGAGGPADRTAPGTGLRSQGPTLLPPPPRPRQRRARPAHPRGG